MLTVQLMPWCPFALWNYTVIRNVNFLGTTIAGSIVYLSCTTFLRMLLLSSRKLGFGIFFISLTLFLQNQSDCCSLPEYFQIRFSHIIGWFPWWCICRLDLLCDVLDGVFHCGWFVFIVIVLIQTKCTESGYCICNRIFLPWICWNLMSNCCSSRAHLSSTELDMPVVKNGASGLWSQYSVHFVPAK